MLTFLRWWLFFILLIVAGVSLFITGVPAVILSGGFISNIVISIILAVLVFITFYSGYLGARIFYAERLAKLNPVKSALIFRSVKKEIATILLCASNCSRIGLIGTVIGFIIMATAMSGFQVGDPAALQAMIVGMSTGIGMALYTTLVGQVANILLMLQYHNLRQGLKKVKDD